MSTKSASIKVVGAIISSLLSGSLALAKNGATDITGLNDPKQAATVIAELLELGHIIVDPITGQLRIRTSVLSILKEYNLATQAVDIESTLDADALTVCGEGLCVVRQ